MIQVQVSIKSLSRPVPYAGGREEVQDDLVGTRVDGIRERSSHRTRSTFVGDEQVLPQDGVLAAPAAKADQWHSLRVEAEALNCRFVDGIFT